MSRKRGRATDPQQQGIDFSSRSTERFALLRTLDLGICSEASRIGYLLELIAAIAGDGELDWPLARISQRLRLPEITLRRTIELAERVGVITVRRLARRDGTYGANALAVHWSRIASGQIDAINASRGKRNYQGAPARTPPDQRSTGADRAINRSGPCDPVDHASSLGTSTRNNKPPPPPRKPFFQADPSVWEMAAAVVRLSELKVADASAACRQAEANGVTADVVLALAEHFAARPGAWGPGALHYRVRSAVPGLGVEMGWPPVTAGWKPPEQQALQQRAADDQEAARQQAVREADERNRRRESELGPRLDGLGDEQVAALAAGNSFYAERLRRNGRHSPMVRQWLLLEIERRHTSPPVAKEEIAVERSPE